MRVSARTELSPSFSRSTGVRLLVLVFLIASILTVGGIAAADAMNLTTEATYVEPTEDVTLSVSTSVNEWATFKAYDSEGNELAETRVYEGGTSDNSPQNGVIGFEWGPHNSGGQATGEITIYVKEVYNSDWGPGSAHDETTYVVDATNPSVSDATLSEVNAVDGLVTDGDTITITATVTDDNAVGQVRADASAFGAGKDVELSHDEGDTYEATVEVNGDEVPADGHHAVTITATDDVGNEKSVQTGTLTFDTEPPTIDGAEDVRADPDETIHVDLSDETDEVDPSSIAVTVSDLSGSGNNVLDGATVGETDGLDYGDGTLTIDPAGTDVGSLGDGEVEVTVSAADRMGNAATEEFTVIVDTIVPYVRDAKRDGGTEIDIELESGPSGFDGTTIDRLGADDFDLSPGEVELVDVEDDFEEGHRSVTLSLKLANPVDATTATFGYSGDPIKDRAGNTLSDWPDDVVVPDGVAPTVSGATVYRETDGGSESKYVSDGDEVVVSADVTDDGTGVCTVEADSHLFQADTVGLDHQSGSTYSKTVTIDPADGLPDGENEVTLRTDDCDRNERHDVAGVLTFDTETPVIDSQNTSTNNPDEGIEVALSDETSGVDTDSISVTVEDSDGPVLEGVGTDSSAVAYDGSTVLTVDPDEPYADGPVTIDVDAADQTGNSVTFESVALTVDTEAPTIESATAVNHTEVAVELASGPAGFDGGSVSPDDFAVDGATVESVTGIDGVSDGDATATIDLHLESPVDAETVQVEVVGDGVADRAGNVLVDESDTVEDIDGVAPVIQSPTIPDGDGNGVVTAGDEITITADVTDGGTGVETVTADASAFGAGSDVALTTDGDGDTYAASVVVDAANATQDDNHAVSIASIDAADNERTDVTTGELTLDTVPPALDGVVSVNETALAVSISDDTSGLAAETVTRDRFAVDVGSIGAVTGVDAIDDGDANATVTLHLVSPVDGDTVTVTLTGDGVGDLAKNNVTAVNETATGMDGVAPSVELVDPTNGTSVTDRHQRITVNVSDGVGVDTDTIRVTVDDGNVYDDVGVDHDAIAYDAANDTLTIEPNGTYAYGDVDVTVTVADEAGNPVTARTAFGVVSPPTDGGPDPVADVRVTSVSLDRNEIAPDESATATITLRNDGNGDGVREVALAIDGDVVDDKRVLVRAGASHTVTFTRQFDVAGTYAVGADDIERELVVERPPSDDGTPTPDDATPAGDDDGPADSNGQAGDGDGPSSSTADGGSPPPATADSGGAPEPDGGGLSTGMLLVLGSLLGIAAAAGLLWSRG